MYTCFVSQCLRPLEVNKTNLIILKFNIRRMLSRIHITHSMCWKLWVFIFNLDFDLQGNFVYEHWRCSSIFSFIVLSDNQKILLSCILDIKMFGKIKDFYIHFVKKVRNLCHNAKCFCVLKYILQFYCTIKVYFTFTLRCTIQLASFKNKNMHLLFRHSNWAIISRKGVDIGLFFILVPKFLQ